MTGHADASGATREGDPTVTLATPPGSPVGYEVTITDAAGDGVARTLTVTGPAAGTGAPTTGEYRLPARTHNAYLDAFEGVARRFGTRTPRNRQPHDPPDFRAPYRPLLTENLSPRMRHGYGDPAVLRVDERDAHGAADVWYYLVATSNDAPDSFPILRSRDLQAWEFVGFVFPRGHKPPWAADGEGVSDYWAPEMHRVGGEFRVYFTARERERGELCIGVATAPRPDGPFTTPDEPILRGDVIDSHLLVDGDGTAYLLWKEDANGVWPTRLHALLHHHGRLITELFPRAEDRRTASLLATLWPWARGLEHMERFFVQQVLVEAVTADFTAFQERLAAVLDREADADVGDAIRGVHAALRTPIHARPLTSDGLALTGAPTRVLENDRAWEAHLIEGVWVTRHGGRYYLFYAGNDFSTARYGIGVAVADSPLGPYRKAEEPFLRSTAEWWGPGHPSVAPGPDGEPWLFLHAFFPARMGYNEFRALLTVPIAFEADGVTVR